MTRRAALADAARLCSPAPRPDRRAAPAGGVRPNQVTRGPLATAPHGGRCVDRPRLPHVLVARQDNDGDVLLAGPAIRAIATAAGQVTLLCGPRGTAAAELLPGVDRVVVHRAEWIDPDVVPFVPSNSHGLIRTIAGRACDEAVILTSFHQSPLPLALLLRLAGVPRISAISDDFPGSLLDLRHRVPDDLHEVERSLSLVTAAGYALPHGDDGALRVRRPAQADAALLPPQPYVVVHPGASVTARAWAPERNAELVAELAARGHAVVVTGAPSERALTAQVAGSHGLDLGGETTLAQLAETIAHAAAIVIGNTGPAHLAAAVGTPVVSLFAPTVPAVRWRPWKVPHLLLHDPVPCAGCRARDCPVPGHPCIDEIPVATVVEAVERLARTRPSSAAGRATQRPAESPAARPAAGRAARPAGTEATT